MDKMNGELIACQVMKQGMLAEGAGWEKAAVDIGPGRRRRRGFMTGHQRSVQELKEEHHQQDHGPAAEHHQPAGRSAVLLLRPAWICEPGLRVHSPRKP